MIPVLCDIIFFHKLQISCPHKNLEAHPVVGAPNLPWPDLLQPEAAPVNVTIDRDDELDELYEDDPLTPQVLLL